jgi:hypothetical protein
LQFHLITYKDDIMNYKIITSQLKIYRQHVK